MKITLSIDDELYEEALAVADPTMDKADLFSEVLREFIRVQTAKRLRASDLIQTEAKRGNDNSVDS